MYLPDCNKSKSNQLTNLVRGVVESLGRFLLEGDLVVVVDHPVTAGPVLESGLDAKRTT